MAFTLINLICVDSSSFLSYNHPHPSYCFIALQAIPTTTKRLLISFWTSVKDRRILDFRQKLQSLVHSYPAVMSLLFCLIALPTQH
jgi:hypothetical protein